MILYAAIGAVEQGLVYGIVVIGVYLTFRILDFPDLTVDGSLALGAAISAVAITGGYNPYLSLVFAARGGFLAGVVTAVFEYQIQDPSPAGIDPDHADGHYDLPGGTAA